MRVVEVDDGLRDDGENLPDRGGLLYLLVRGPEAHVQVYAAQVHVVVVPPDVVLDALEHVAAAVALELDGLRARGGRGGEEQRRERHDESARAARGA